MRFPLTSPAISSEQVTQTPLNLPLCIPSPCWLLSDTSSLPLPSFFLHFCKLQKLISYSRLEDCKHSEDATVCCAGGQEKTVMDTLAHNQHFLGSPPSPLLQPPSAGREPLSAAGRWCGVLFPFCESNHLKGGKGKAGWKLGKNPLYLVSFILPPLWTHTASRAHSEIQDNI